MNYNILLEMSKKLEIELNEIKRYHCIFKDIGIIPKGISIIRNPKKKRYKEREKIMHDGYAVVKQERENNVVIKIRYNEITKKTKIIYILFLLDDGLYFVHNYDQNRQGDTIEFSYYNRESCSTVVKLNRKLGIDTMCRFDTMGIMEDYSEKAKVFDIELEGGFAHYVSKIDKSSKKKVLNWR